MFCWLFYIIGIIFKLFFDMVLFYWLVYLGFMLVVLNSVINLVIYLLFDKIMRGEFKIIFRVC